LKKTLTFDERPSTRTKTKESLKTSSMLSNWWLELSLEYESFDLDTVFESLAFPIGLILHSISIYSIIEQNSYDALPKGPKNTSVSPLNCLFLLFSTLISVILYHQSKSYALSLTPRYILFQHETPSNSQFGNSSIPSRNASLVNVDMSSKTSDTQYSFIERFKSLWKRDSPLDESQDSRWRLKVWTPSTSLLMLFKMYSPLTAGIYLSGGYTAIVLGVCSSIMVRLSTNH
jgi:hypothetical protein